MNERVILALDPGGTTGYAYEVFNNVERKIISGELLPNNHHKNLELLLDLVNPSHLITERFDNRGKKGVELISVEYIGIARLWAEYRNVPFIEQPQLKGKQGLWTDEKLKILGLYKSTKGGHSNDAIRQLLWYITHGLDEEHYLYQYREMKDGN